MQRARVFVLAMAIMGVACGGEDGEPSGAECPDDSNLTWPVARPSNLQPPLLK